MIKHSKRKKVLTKRRKKGAVPLVREKSPEWHPVPTTSRPKIRTSAVAMKRKYAVTTVNDARIIAKNWLTNFNLENAVDFGLPEVDDRYHVWRVPLVKKGSNRGLQKPSVSVKWLWTLLTQW